MFATVPREEDSPAISVLERKKQRQDAKQLANVTALGDGIGALVYLTAKGMIFVCLFICLPLIYCASHNFYCGVEVLIKSCTITGFVRQCPENLKWGRGMGVC